VVLVDIFFVISGFLMTNILLNAFYTNNKINLFKFYLSRARRIIPALYVALFITLIISAIIYAFDDMLKSFDIGKAFLFVSNIYFSKAVKGYWDSDIYISPFLHTWSLAVEWQFYIIYPILSIIISYLFKNKKFENKLLILNIAIFVISLLISNYYLNINKDKYAFYLLQSRAFELAIGGIVALIIFKNYKLNLKNLYLNSISVIASIILLLSLFIDVKPLGFPSFGSLIPTLSTAILIFILTNHKNYLYKFLANKVMVHIGNLSYSLYLYHFIVYIFFKYILNIYFLDFKLSYLDELIIVILTFVFAFLSYNFIEKPAKKLSVKYLLLLMFILSFFPVIHYINSAKLNKINLLQKYHNFINIKEIDFRPTVNISTEDMNALLIGDSHARDYSLAFSSFVSNKNFNPYILNDWGCDILKPNSWNGGDINDKCLTYYNTIINTIENNKIDYIFIALYDRSHNMNNYYDFINIVNKSQKIKIVILGLYPDPIAREADIIYSMSKRENRTLFGYKFSKQLPQNFTGKLQDVSYIYEEYNKITTRYPNVQFFDARPYFTNSIINNKIMYSDSNHLNMEHGQPYLSKVFNENFKLK
jgi:peptidoglycan/LPS O-acetylase OafA/YrhL